MKRWYALALAFIFAVLLFAVPARAARQPEMAQEISSRRLLRSTAGISNAGWLFDGYTTDFATVKQNAELTLSHDGGIGSLFLRFGWEPGEYTVTNEDTGESRTWGGQGILHEFLDLEAAFGTAPGSVTLCFRQGAVRISEIRAFSSGETPEDVQKWEAPAEGEADIVLFSAHGDDEQLFFAGLIPYYAAERGCKVQVVYLTDHRNMTLRRVGEMLDGLWAVGLRIYPVFGGFGDFLSGSREEALEIYRNKGVSQEDILSFVVENIRRFRPSVAVGHDLKGEYGHGMHMVYADALCEAVTLANDPEKFPESAGVYGVWDVPKTYLHLYPENPVVMDWDQPLESFSGMTAYEVTRDLGFPCHSSQQTYYSWYFAGMDKAADIAQYSPREYGLYRSAVGPDVEKKDLLENITEPQEEYPEETVNVIAQTEAAVEIPAVLPQTVSAVREEPAKKDEFPVVVAAVAAGGGLLLAAAGITKSMEKRKEKYFEKK